MKYVLVLCLAVFCSNLLSSRAKAQSKPNIVIIMADDMGFADIGCYGSEIATPNLDKLAAGGLRFTQFYNCARCCPTRAALMTGLYPHQAGVGHMVEDNHTPGYRGVLSDRCGTIAEVLRAGGYRTLMAGKWHVGTEKGHWPRDRGFDRFYGSPTSPAHYFGLTPGRLLLKDDESITPPPGWHSTDAWADNAIEFIDEAAKLGKPFFLYLAHNAPHWPLHAKPEDIAKYEGKYAMGWDELRARRHKRMIELGLVDKAWPLSPRDPNEKAWKDLNPERQKFMAHKMAVYAAQIDRMDQSTGRVLDKLRALKLDENTLVMFLADNGGCAEEVNRDPPGTVPGSGDTFQSYGRPWANASNTPFRFYKHWVHEGGIATPLVVSWPAKVARPGAVTQQVGHVVDLMATCVDAAGVEYPKSRDGREIVPMEGKSLLPALRGEDYDRGMLGWEHEGNRAVRDGNWKLVARHGQPWELYDLAADRSELNNLAAEQPEKAKALAAKYAAWAERCQVLPWGEHRAGGGKKAKKEN